MPSPAKDRTGLTQAELAERAQISLPTLQRIEQTQNDNPGIRIRWGPLLGHLGSPTAALMPRVQSGTHQGVVIHS